MPGKVHAVDIHRPVQEPGSGKTGQPGWLWVYVRDDRNAGSQMPRRSGSRTHRTERYPSTESSGRLQRVLQADAYGGYRAL